MQGPFTGTVIPLFHHTNSEVSGTLRVFISDNKEATGARLPDFVNPGYTKMSVRTVDTYVVIFAVMAAQRLNILMGFAFPTGSSFRFLAGHDIANTVGPNKYRALPSFHAFTGCNTVSCFGGWVKKTAW